MKNFAGQPEGGGNITILTAQDLMFDVSPTPPIFKKRPIFVDNCKNCKMENFSNFGGEDYGYDYGAYDDSPQQTTLTSSKRGSFWDDFNIGDVLKVGTTVLDEATRKKKEEAALAQGQIALEIEQQRLEQERLKAERAKLDAEKAGLGANKIKAYILPITITGVLVIGGIAAYFYFKKKKIN
jgi:hypothetical protein